MEDIQNKSLNINKVNITELQRQRESNTGPNADLKLGANKFKDHVSKESRTTKNQTHAVIDAESA